ncbi:MAG TPA: 16S rRNA (uracil(1498)-N(3))-methyltransferase [Actinobacteria bacterium]|nr:16S rRNA (uracil(1498)-N(3))-methyltransferase [Actinomycetota bacterium]HCK78430.1 16S rRNA (uracil(1498)-N(3))-methyltransferase [Actinomycetota bacterium]
MSAPLFFVDRQDLLAGDRVIVSGAEGRHAVTVARLQHGERVDLGDGAGLLVAGQVIRAQAPDLLEVQVLERIIAPDPDPRLVVVQALPKGDRGELAVELLTEVGVDAIVPWAAARSIAQWRGDRGERSLHKWRDAARAAGKQSRRAHLPVVSSLATTGDVLRMVSSATATVVLHEESTAALTNWSPPARGEIVVVVGPEGGLTADEVSAFREAGAEVRHLGPSVMRTSTAGAAASAVLLAATGRWSL